MRKARLKDTLNFRVTDKTRTTIENFADIHDRALADVAREFLEAGMRAQGIS